MVRGGQAGKILYGKRRVLKTSGPALLSVTAGESAVAPEKPQKRARLLQTDASGKVPAAALSVETAILTTQYAIAADPSLAASAGGEFDDDDDGDLDLEGWEESVKVSTSSIAVKDRWKQSIERGSAGSLAAQSRGDAAPICTDIAELAPMFRPYLSHSSAKIDAVIAKPLLVIDSRCHDGNDRKRETLTRHPSGNRDHAANTSRETSSKGVSKSAKIVPNARAQTNPPKDGSRELSDDSKEFSHVGNSNPSSKAGGSKMDSNIEDSRAADKDSFLRGRPGASGSAKMGFPPRADRREPTRQQASVIPTLTRDKSSVGSRVPFLTRSDSQNSEKSKSGAPILARSSSQPFITTKEKATSSSQPSTTAKGKALSSSQLSVTAKPKAKPVLYSSPVKLSGIEDYRDFKKSQAPVESYTAISKRRREEGLQRAKPQIASLDSRGDPFEDMSVSHGEVLQGGLNKRFYDEMDYIFDGLGPNSSVAVRRSSSLEFAKKVGQRDLYIKLKAHNLILKGLELIATASCLSEDPASGGPKCASEAPAPVFETNHIQALIILYILCQIPDQRSFNLMLRSSTMFPRLLAWIKYLIELVLQSKATEDILAVPDETQAVGRRKGVYRARPGKLSKSEERTVVEFRKLISDTSLVPLPQSTDAKAATTIGHRFALHVLERHMIPPVQNIHSSIVNNMFSTSCRGIGENEPVAEAAQQPDDDLVTWLERSGVYAFCLDRVCCFPVLEACTFSRPLPACGTFGGTFYRDLLDLVQTTFAALSGEAWAARKDHGAGYRLDLLLRILLNTMAGGCEAGAAHVILHERPEFVVFLVDRVVLTSASVTGDRRGEAATFGVYTLCCLGILINLLDADAETFVTQVMKKQVPQRKRGENEDSMLEQLLAHFGKASDASGEEKAGECVFESTYLGVLLGGIHVHQKRESGQGCLAWDGQALSRVHRRVRAFARDGEFMESTGVESRAMQSLEQVRHLVAALEE